MHFSKTHNCDEIYTIAGIRDRDSPPKLIKIEKETFLWLPRSKQKLITR